MSAIHAHNPGACCGHGHGASDHDHSHEWRSDLGFTLCCLVFLLVGFVVEKIAPGYAWIAYGISFAAGGSHPMLEALGSLRRFKLDVDFLMVFVALGAWIVGHPAEGATLLVLFGASHAMEAYAAERTRNAVQSLMTAFPKTARRMAKGAEEEVLIESLLAGDMIVVRPGDTFPVDSVVREGRTTADLSAINGEEDPLAADPGTEVPSGAINGGGLVTVEALRPASESSYQKIIRLIENAPERRAPQQVVSDRVGEYFTIAILSASVLAFLFWWRVSGMEITVAAYRAMVLLVAGSPCALVLSIPSAILTAISSGARRGVLFHGGRGLMGLASITAIAFDKTGTLTTGEPRVDRVATTEPGDSELYPLALGLARASTHPAARSVGRHVSPLVGDKSAPSLVDVLEVPGQGVQAVWRGVPVRLGRDPNPDEDQSPGPRVALVVDGRVRMRFLLRETVRPFAACAMAWLRIHGTRLLLLSGDAPSAVAAIAQQLGLTDARGGLRPEDKHRIIEEETKRGRIMMVGDGVNDAPALAIADVGVAMGMRGSAATLAQADIILVRDRLMDLVTAIELAQQTRRIIRQNMTIAIGAAAILVTFALIGGLPLSLGVFGHEGGTVLVVLNSLRLLIWKSPHDAAARDERKSLAAAVPVVPAS